MKQGFSLGVDVTVNEDGEYDASISYLDTDNNEIMTTAQGTSIEEVCLNLYDELTKQISLLEEENYPEDMTDAEYIAYLEEEIERLREEKNNSHKMKVISKEDFLRDFDKSLTNKYNTFLKYYKYF